MRDLNGRSEEMVRPNDHPAKVRPPGRANKNQPARKGHAAKVVSRNRRRNKIARMSRRRNRTCK